MFPQSCNYLPNKKQSVFGSPLSQNMGLLRNFTSMSCSTFDDMPISDNIGLCVGVNTAINNNNTLYNSGTSNIMDFVYSLKDSSRIKLDRRYISSFSMPAGRSPLNCKKIVGTCNNMPELPLAPSHLVGGFVGSKSQLGRRRKHDFGVKMWDIIRDLVDLVGNTQSSFPEKQSNQCIPSFEKKSQSKQDSNMQNESGVQVFNAYNSTDFRLNCIRKESMVSPKQSYADVAKRPIKEYNSVKVNAQPLNVASSNVTNTLISVIEPLSPCTINNFYNRDRIASECSADSEDSFVVFEYCDENNEKDSYISDDEPPSPIDDELQSDSGITLSGCTSNCSKQSPKKVRFAEGKSLAKVHPMVKWDFAYRMARRGPWEMFARDSERFKLRISKTEAVLKPILDQQHRSVVFRERFRDSVQ